MEDRTIEKITFYKDTQSIGHREIYEHNGIKIKLELESDSFEQQCFAKAYALDGLKWNEIYSIPFIEMKTPKGLSYQSQYINKESTAEVEFQQDVKRLKKYINMVL